MSERSASAAVVSFALVAVGCYASHELPGAPGASRCADSAFGPERTIFEPSDVRPVLQGSDFSIAAMEDGYLLVWVENRGRSGIGLSGALVDLEGRLRGAAFEIGSGGEDGTERVETVAAAGLGELGARVVWIERPDELWTALVRPDGTTTEAAPVGFTTAQRVPILARAAGERTEVVVAGPEGPTLVTLDGEGGLTEAAVLRSPAPDWVWAADRFEGTTAVAWSDRVPAGEDTLWIALGDAPPVELVRRENVMLGHWGRPLVAREGAAALAASYLPGIALFYVDEEGADIYELGPEYDERPVIVGEGDRLFVLAAGGPSAPSRLPSGLGLRDLRIEGERLIIGEPEVLAENPTSCSVEAYHGVRAPSGDAVAWVESCEVRRLKLRTRCTE